MLKKGSKLYSILTGSCPRCHKESMYLDKNPYHLNNLFKMNEKCSNCATKYMLEPSFFYGAMYVSYALNVALMVAIFVIEYLLFKAIIFTIFTSIVVVLIVLFPLVSRIARNLYINLFISYKKEN